MFARRKRVGPSPGVGEALTVAASGSRSPSWPSYPPEGYLGQLRPEFQQSLAVERAGLTRHDCAFYHTVELPPEGLIRAPWDLRGREEGYLGGIALRDKRVLELGPATGHLTFYMEEQGADVVCLDAGFDVSIDLLPAPGGETRKLRMDHAQMVSSFQNSWWYLHRQRQSSARMVYGNIYALPGDLGEFDISTFGAILLHLRSPIAALEQAARRTTQAIVVTEPWPHERGAMYENSMTIFPNGEAGRWVSWWTISAGAVVQMLKILGFGRTTVTEHTQLHQHGHLADAPYTEQPMFTVVGHRD